jgi:hypothetical protein
MKQSNNNLASHAFIALALLAALMFAASSARADIVTVDITGSVEWNQITAPPLGMAHAGDAAHLSFTIDSSNFVNNPQFPTRGYPIDKDSFKLKFPTFEIGLQSPYPAGQTPYFVIRNNDPQVDGFFVATNTGAFQGVPLNQTGAVTQFANEFHVTYEGTRLSSLDVLGAVGHYDFTGLSVFNWTIDDGPFNPMGILFNEMNISVPEPASLATCAIGGLSLLARRRR